MKIKEKLEDFVVNEVMNLDFCEGSYNYYLVKKKGRNTKDVVKFLKAKLNTKIGFAGLKDKHALTSQYFSVYQRKIFLDMDGVEFEFVGSGSKRINLGDHKGNEFKIVIRDLDKELNPVENIINYFGPQRFSKNNVDVGKALVQKDFAKACSLLELKVAKNDYIGVLRKFGLKKLKFFIHAYQSWLWNKVAKTVKKGELELVGFLTKDPRYDKVLAEEGIVAKDFIIRQIPELSAEGSPREVIVNVGKFKTLEFSDDELNEGKKKQVVSFYLPKGSYATVVVESLLNN